MKMKHPLVLLFTASVIPFVDVCSRGPESSLVSGIQLADMDISARPQDDFYRYANGQWLDRTEIPDDKSGVGVFSELDDQSIEDVRAIVDELLAKPNIEEGSDEQRVADFYRSYVDTDRRNELGISPIREIFDAVDGIENKSDLISFFGATRELWVKSPIRTSVQLDAGDSSHYILHISQSGIGLPDRDYYINDSERFATIRKEYLAYIQRLSGEAGFTIDAESAGRILELETLIAQIHWTRVQNRDAEKRYNKMSVGELQSLAQEINWAQFLNTRGFGQVENLVVAQPDYLAGLAALVDSVPLADWKAYLSWHALNSNAGSLTETLEKGHFDFYGTVLRGQVEQEVLWKRGVRLLNQQIGEILGKVYVARHFDPKAKARMQGLVENLREAYRQGIDEIDWMTEETKVQARKKLAAFTPKIGYPDRWKDYEGLEVAADDLVGNLASYREVVYQDSLSRLQEPVRKWEWHMNPQTVNAYYNPPQNEIVFPAAILQPPFFNMEADDAANYGAIGAVIGHEMGHGFDDQGSKYDAEGNMRNWWTDTDRAEFEERTQGLVAQYAAYRPFVDLAVNGELTLGENIGDLAGLTIAYKAYRISLGGEPAPVIDGLTGDQRFFLSWAQAWHSEAREKALRQRIATDPHSPPVYRVLGPLSNLPEFHDAFDVNPGDAMYIPPEQRVKIW